jgi:hypothetical protein
LVGTFREKIRLISLNLLPVYDDECMEKCAFKKGRQGFGY